MRTDESLNDSVAGVPDISLANALEMDVVGEIRAHMARRRWTQNVVAAKCGWTQSYLARRLVGRMSLSLDDIGKLAAIFGVPMASLLTPPTTADTETERVA